MGVQIQDIVAPGQQAGIFSSGAAGDHVHLQAIKCNGVHFPCSECGGLHHAKTDVLVSSLVKGPDMEVKPATEWSG